MSRQRMVLYRCDVDGKFARIGLLGAPYCEEHPHAGFVRWTPEMTRAADYLQRDRKFTPEMAGTTYYLGCTYQDAVFADCWMLVWNGLPTKYTSYPPKPVEPAAAGRRGLYG